MALPSVEMSKRRVAERVMHGGHNIPVGDIERRFPRSLCNLLDIYSYKVDVCYCYLNLDDGPKLVFTQRSQWCTIIEPELFELLHKASIS